MRNSQCHSAKAHRKGTLPWGRVSRLDGDCTTLYLRQVSTVPGIMYHHRACSELISCSYNQRCVSAHAYHCSLCLEIPFHINISSDRSLQTELILSLLALSTHPRFKAELQAPFQVGVSRTRVATKRRSVAGPPPHAVYMCLQTIGCTNPESV